MNNIHPTMAGALRGFMPVAPATQSPTKRTYSGDTATVSFMGFDLTVEVDADGHIEGILSPDGSDVYCMFQEWALDDIKKLVDHQAKQNRWDDQYDRGADRYEDRRAA